MTHMVRGAIGPHRFPDQNSPNVKICKHVQLLIIALQVVRAKIIGQEVAHGAEIIAFRQDLPRILTLGCC